MKLPLERDVTSSLLCSAHFPKSASTVFAILMLHASLSQCRVEFCYMYAVSADKLTQFPPQLCNSQQKETSRWCPTNIPIVQVDVTLIQSSAQPQNIQLRASFSIYQSLNSGNEIFTLIIYFCYYELYVTSRCHNKGNLTD